MENKLRDSKEWFREHRKDYDRLVLDPMRQLVLELQPGVWKLDDSLIAEPKVGRSISRIYRDTRFTKDKSTFRDVCWCVFLREKKLYQGPPAFYFEFSPRFVRWGCGYYRASPRDMDTLRGLILRQDPDFYKADKAVGKNGYFLLEGDRYKRSKFPQAQGREKLLFAPNPAAPRLHLTAASPENPPEPPMFCMFLRKHLLGARLSEISQTPMERCAVFSFDCTDEMGYPIQKRLVAELMGRTCNVYLLEPEGRILDCLRRIGLDESSRPALPGLSYQNPSPIEKRNPAEMTQEDYVNLLTAEGADVLSQRLMDALGGLSPLVTREAALFAAGDTDARVSALDADRAGEKLYLFFEEHLRHPAPWYYAAPDGTLKQFAFCPIREYGDCARAESFSGLLDRFYTIRDRKDAMRQKSQSLRKSVTNQVQRLRRKMALQEKELTATYDRERLRQLGDILTANLHRIQKGQTKITCQNFYDEGMGDVEIPLSPILSPQQNAAKFYKDYTRMKNAQKELTHQLELGTEECSYLESVL